MANLMSNPTNFPRRINMYVPAMQYASDVNWNGQTRVNFGAAAAAGSQSVLPATSIAVAGQADISNAVGLVPYGRTIQMSASGASGATVVVYGFDYLGQPMAEQFTLNGVTLVQGKKAFRAGNYVTWTARGAVNLTITNGTSFGLPYKAARALWESANGVVGGAGTLAPPSLVFPQTLLTTDPRGVYLPTAVPNGSIIITAAFDMFNDVDSSNRGGLHGIPHIAA